MKITTLVSLLFLVLVRTTVGEVDVQRLELDHQPFVDEFNAAEGRVRLVAMLSPT